VIYANPLPPLPKKKRGGASVDIKLECRGDIGSEIRFRYGNKNGTPVCTFGIRHTFSAMGARREKWFSFVAFGPLGEWIATHFAKGDTIHVLRARYSQTNFIKADKKVIQMPVWIIEEIADPADDDEALANEAPIQTHEFEFVDDLDDGEEEDE
jgi:hypothetical protein